MAGNIREFLTREELEIEIDSDSAALLVCDPKCIGITDITDLDQEDHENNLNDQENQNNDDDNHNAIAIWMASSAVVILLLVIIIFVIYKYVPSQLDAWWP